MGIYVKISRDLERDDLDNRKKKKKKKKGKKEQKIGPTWPEPVRMALVHHALPPSQGMS